MVGKANKVLGLLKRSFVSRESKLWKNLYTSIVRPHLEYASSVWKSLLQKEIDELEKVQKRATRIPTDAYKLKYEDRLKMWDLTNLEERRKRGDLIQMYKEVNGLEKINWHTGPSFAPDSQTRATEANNKRLLRESFPATNQNNFCHFTNVRNNFFLNRITYDLN